jgi:coatomer protein complex subunit gamma
MKVIRIVNNRIHLEESEIRAAAVGVLGKFAVNYPD